MKNLPIIVNSIRISFEFYLISFNLFVQIRGSSPNPIISYCTSETDSLFVLSECNFTTISNSTFEFGKIDQNLIQLNSKSDPQYVFVKCEAPYPIRWLAPKPLGSVHYISTDDTNRFHKDPLNETDLTLYIQAIFVNIRETFTPKLRCESYSFSKIASEVFINVIIIGNDHEDVWDYTTWTSLYFVVDDIDTKSGGFIIPAVAKEFQGNYLIPVTKSNLTKNTLREVDDSCAECICRASSHCQNFPCDSENVCGEIPRKYSEARHGFNDCKREETCARDLIEKYYYEKRWGDSEYDCNEDGVLTCEDFFWIHFKYNNDQCPTLNSSELGNATTWSECMNKNQLTFNWVRRQPNDYDPRIGLKVDEFPDHDFKYEFSIPFGLDYGGTLALYPRKRDDRIDAKIYYEKQLDLFHCKITTPGIYDQPHILIGKCESFAECPLKFEPLWPAVLTSGYSQLTNQFEELTPSGNDPHTSFTTSYSHGYLECFGTYSRAQFLSKVDYFFTGLDNAKYLVSELFPPESIIMLSTKQEQSMRVGRTYSFDCKISTFVLLPNIKFVLGFQNGTDHLVSSQTTEVVIDSSARITKTATLTWQINAKIKVGLSKIACYAPRINSSDWARSEMYLTVANDEVHPNPSKSRPGSQVLENYTTDQIRLYLKIGGAIAGVVIILLVVLSVYLATRKKVVVIKSLSPEEVDGFILGTATQTAGQSTSSTPDNLAFNNELKICQQDLVTDYKVLGAGQFGIVHQGEYRNQQVAIKSCKPNADREYFKAFLMEIKVMAYIGDHENIVKFLGAVVDDLAKGECLAVIELCPFGNLNSYLRKHFVQESEESRNAYVSFSNEMELQGSLPLSVLLHFSKQIAKGMEYLAQKNVIHGDLATRNVLVFEKFVVKVTDFGLSRQLYSCANYKKRSQVPLPLAWMALESLSFKEFSTKSDVWSFGVTMWEIFSKGRTPYSGIVWSSDFVDQIEAGLRLKKPTLAPDVLFNFMLTCWENCPENRPTFTECVKFISLLEPLSQQSSSYIGI